MSRVDEKTIDQLAHLARLQFSPEEKKQIEKDLTRMLDFVDKLKEVDTEGVEPLIYMTDEVNMLREDNIKEEITHQEALLNAPKKDSDYFKVPRVVERK